MEGLFLRWGMPRHIWVEPYIHGMSETKEGGLGDLFRPLGYVGTVQAVRQGYEVYRNSGGDFLVFSPSNRGAASFHMTVVSSMKVESVAGALTKAGVTSGSLLKNEEVARAFGMEGLALRFDLLMALYVLTALGRAKMERTGRNLVFRKPAKEN